MCARDAKGTKAFARQIVNLILSFFARVCVGMHKVEYHLRRSLRDFESGVVVLDLGLGSLADGIEGCEVSNLIGLQCRFIAETSDDSLVDAVAALGSRRQRP